MKRTEAAKNYDYGYITMNSIGNWTWWPTKPELINCGDGHYAWGISQKSSNILNSKNELPNRIEDIEPVKNWKKSLIKCGRK